VPDDPLDAVLRLVAEGRLTADEAKPILDAIEAREAAPPTPGPSAEPATSPGGGPGRAIRLEVTDKGRKVVNLRVPLSLGRAALDRVPGLSEATTQRIREAIEGGITGPILQVDDADDGVRVVIE
jgi:hypothetical protein